MTDTCKQNNNGARSRVPSSSRNWCKALSWGEGLQRWRASAENGLSKSIFRPVITTPPAEIESLKASGVLG